MELRECPFCGGEASFDHDDNGWNWVVCEKCGVSTDCRTHTMEDCHPLLAEQWNRRASPASAPAGWKHSCNALCMDDVELWIPQCPHCGKPAPATQVSEDRKDAERFRFMLDDHAEKTTRQRVRELFERLPVMSLSAARAAIDDLLKGE